MPRKEATSKEIPFVDGMKTVEIQEIALEDIKIDDNTYQYRISSGVRDLRLSILREGQKEPVDLTGSKPYRIIDGFRRVEAIRGIKWTTVKALVHRGINDDEAHKLAFIKNVVRKNLSPIEKANAIYLAKQRGMKMSEVADNFCLSEKQVRRYELLLSFPPELQKPLDKGEITMAHAAVLAAFKVKGFGEWVEKIKSVQLSTKQLKRELKKASGAKQPGRKKTYLKKESGGIRMYPFSVRKDASRDEKDKVIKVLEEAIEVLKR